MNIHNGNRIQLLKNGGEFFPALIAAIGRAVKDVRIETYIFRDDTSGNLIAAALKSAAGRGVRVCVLIDAFGSHETPDSFFDDMRTAGVEILQFAPIRRLLMFSRTGLRRNHRKIVLVDGAVGFVGGINLIDDLTDSLSEFPRFDYAVQFEGPVLADVYPTVNRLWTRVALLQMQRKSRDVLHTPRTFLSVGSQQAAFVVRDNLLHRRGIERIYRQAIGQARQDVLIVCPYFLPGRRLRRALIEASQRGVAVTILLQGRADHPMMQLATRALYTQLLGAGVMIHEYQKSMLHGKVAVIDGRWATVGSSNLDPFSLFMNREANLVIFDQTFAEQLRQSVEAEIAENATICCHEDWRKRSMLERAKTWMAYGFTRWIVGLIGYAR